MVNEFILPIGFIGVTNTDIVFTFRLKIKKGTKFKILSIDNMDLRGIYYEVKFYPKNLYENDKFWIRNDYIELPPVVKILYGNSNNE